MPNLLQQFFAESQSYVVMRDLIVDAKHIRETVMGTLSGTAQDVDKALQTNPYLRRARQWFADKHSDLSDHDVFEQSDEFDPGVHAPDSEEAKPRVLDYDNYEDIAKSVTNERFKIEEQNLRERMLNTAEVISSMNKRNSEVLAQLRRTDDIVTKLANNLDKLIKSKQFAVEQYRRQNVMGAYNASGMLTLGSSLDYMKQNITKKLSEQAFKKSVIASFDSIIATRLLNYQHMVMVRILRSHVVKKLLKKPLEKQGGNDFSVYVKNQYTTDKALFDNMTRKTIIDIIPGYLKRITYATTGLVLNVSNQGTLTTRTPEDPFDRIIDNTFTSSNIHTDTFKKLTARSQSIDAKVTSGDVREAQNQVVSNYVFSMLKNGKRSLSADTFKQGLDSSLMHHVATSMSKGSKKSIHYWMRILKSFGEQLKEDKRYRDQLAMTINSAAARFHRESVEAATNAKGTENMKYTQQRFDQRGQKRLETDTSKFEYDGKTLRQLVKEKVIKFESLSEYDRAHMDDVINRYGDLQDRVERGAEETAYTKIKDIVENRSKTVERIFKMLNRGINVYIFPYVDTPLINLGVMDVPAIAQSDDIFPFRKQQPNTVVNDGTVLKNTLNNLIPKVNKSGQVKLNTQTNDFKDLVNEQNSDEQKANEILAGVTASVKSDDGYENLNAMKSKIGEVKSQSTSDLLKKTIDGILSRAKQKLPDKTSIGKAFTWIFGIGKTAVSKVFEGAKSFFTNIVLRGAKILADAFGKIGRGAEGVWEGIFGSDESEGILKDTSNAFKTATNAVKHTAQVVYNKAIKPIVSPIAKRVKPIAKKVAKGAKNVAKKVGETATSLLARVEEVASGFANKLTSKITDFMKKSQFGQGFMSVMEKKNKIPAQTLADDSIDATLQMINGTDAKPSIFQTIVVKLGDSKESIEEWFTAKLEGIDKAKEKKKAKEDAKKKKQQKEEKSEHSIGFDIGKVMGGITSILTGIMQAALTIVLSMSSVKAIMELGKEILEHALAPLNKVFQQLVKALKPVVAILSKTLKSIVEYIVEIFNVVIEIIKPILELIGPLLQQIMEVLKPILDMVMGLIDVLMVPLTALMKTVVVPILQSIGNCLEIIGGIVQVGLGLIITGLGGILMAVGMLSKFFAKADVYDTGKQLFEMGTNLAKNGATAIVSGMKKQVETIASYYKGLANAVLNPASLMEDEEPAEEQQQPRVTVEAPAIHGSPMDGLFASGDENAPFKLDDNVQEALNSLKTIVSGIFGLFNVDKADELEEKLNDAEESSKYDQAKIDTSGMSEEELKEIDDRAFELFKNSTTCEQLEGESDEDYRKRYEQNKAKWWTMAATEKLHTKVKSVADGNDAGAISMINESLGEYDAETGEYKNMSKFANSMYDSLKKVDDTEFERVNSDFVSGMANASRGGYEDEWYYEGGTGDIIKAAAETFVATRKAAGHYLQEHGETIRNVKFDDGMTIDVVSAMCTGMLAAIVKRMGYYLPSHGQAYTDTYQGDPYMTPTIGQNSWGLDNADGRPNIYNRDGTKSTDWTIVKDGSHQSGDLTFAVKSVKAVHGHMPVFKNDSGYWFGFNGGRYDSRENSVRLGEYYLSHGALPPGSNPGIQTEGNPYDQQIGALAAPMEYKIRYTGPKEKMRRRVRRTSGASSVIGGSKEDWIRTVAMMFEGYYYNGDKYYDNVNTHTFKIRDGRTVKARPDCSGMLGAAMTAMGYQLDYPPSSTHYNVTGCNNTLNFIHDPDGSVSKDWQLLKFNGHNLEPGDITGNTAHASFPITNLEAGFPLGMDAGGTANIRQSAIAARAYLDGETNIPWRSAMGSGAFTSVGGAKNIVRYVGGGNTAGITRPAATTRRNTSTPANTNTSALRGSTNAEKIWNYFRGKGLTAAGTAGLMGNLDAESALRPNNLEDTREGKLGSDTVYTSRVDSGAYKNFTTDNAGYGLAQWTVSDRKSPLYQYKTSRGTSIGDLGMQLDYLNSELTGKFPGINSVLRTTSDVNAASDKVLKEFERPAVLNYQARRSKAMNFYNKFGSGDEEAVYEGWDEPFDPTPMAQLASQLPALPYTEPMYVPELDTWKLDESFAEEPQAEPQVTIVNQYVDTDSLHRYIDEILNNEYAVESAPIQRLVNDIMIELPEYLEDDEDDLFTEEDNAEIMRMVASFM